MEKLDEYKMLASLEMDTTKIRLATFTALISISFVLAGLAVRENTVKVTWMPFTQSLSQLVFLLGFLFYLFAVFHYWWYHRYTEIYREALKELERRLEIKVYRLRDRPKIRSRDFHFAGFHYHFRSRELHFSWALWVLGAMYCLITVIYTGWLGLGGMIALLILYVILLLCNPPVTIQSSVPKALDNDASESM